MSDNVRWDIWTQFLKKRRSDMIFLLLNSELLSWFLFAMIFSLTLNVRKEGYHFILSDKGTYWRVKIVNIILVYMLKYIFIINK